MGGIDAIVAIRREFSNARIVVLTTFRGMLKLCALSKPGLWIPIEEHASQGIGDTIRTSMPAGAHSAGGCRGTC